MTEEQKNVIRDLYAGRTPRTKANRVVAPLCRADLIRIVDTTPTGSARTIELTPGGRVVAEVQLGCKGGEG